MLCSNTWGWARKAKTTPINAPRRRGFGLKKTTSRNLKMKAPYGKKKEKQAAETKRRLKMDMGLEGG